MARQIKTPGATQVEETAQEEQATAQKADEALEHITGDDQPNIKDAEPTEEELLREELALAKAQLAELKKSTPVAASANGGAPTQPKKRVPVLTKDGWTTKEAD
ncbi:hypothetical protein [Acinetobacter sp. IK40]|uniref:hypothetical protein n=1 Tax=Acinetobacter sp. IK40 TaxID=2928897 RepID=UPI002D1E67BD|nr:hypothetical protein [Acinetobacter sp. IK40]MEB3790130.1 hypothetical protein [Acinetobacter sp. IK40]